MQTLNSQTLFSLFIQNLLMSTPLPICDTVRLGDYVIEGKEYIYNFHFIKCTSSGLLTTNFENIERYDFGTAYPNKTFVYCPKTSYYDADTHKWLGKYLRCIRDIFDIDYMPFYNCFNQEVLTNATDIGTRNTFALPICFNRDYTISFKSTKGCVLKPIIYYNKVIDTDIASGESLSMRSTIIGGRDYDDLASFRQDTTSGNFYKYKDNLHLLVGSDDALQSLVVLEGNYHNAPKVFLGCSDSIIENCHCVSRLSLIDSENRDNHYAFADRLVEALLHNIVNSQDAISGNIKRTQEYLGMDANGVWTNNMKILSFNKYMRQVNPFVTKLDITGNIDKDVETFLKRGGAL